MRRRRSSSSASSRSSPERGRNRSSKHKRRSSSSRSSSRSRKTYEKRRNADRRRSSSLSSGSSSRSSTPSRDKSKKSKKSKSSSRRRSSSQKRKDTHKTKIEMIEREKNFEFKEDIDDLFKNDDKRRQLINKIDDEGGGFKPQAFKSSRSSQSKISKEQMHEKAMFGPTSSSKAESVEPLLDPAKAALLTAPSELNVLNSTAKSIMHENLCVDVAIKEKRWRQKLLDILKSADSKSGSAKILKSAADLSNFGYFQRGSIEEFMKFTAKIITERSQLGSRSSVKEQEYMAHVYVRGDNLAAVLISDQEYPKRVAHTLLNKVLDEFCKVVPSVSWPNLPEGSASYNELGALLNKYQNPKEADALTKLQMDLDETKIILHGTIESVLQRGEKLDDLVTKSEDLGMHSKAFYKTAKKTNACCSYM